MKKSAAVFLLVILVLAAVAANAQMQPKFWIGGGASALMMRSTGVLGAGHDQLNFSLNSSYLDIYVNSDVEEVGMNWPNNLLCGIKPAAGVKFNEQFGVSAAYAIYFKKSSDETYYDTDGVEEITFTLESEWSQNALQLLFQYFPTPTNPGFYLMGGVEMVSLKFSGSESTEHFDGFDTFLASDPWREDCSTSGVVFGLGYDIAPMEKMTMFGAMTYSLVQFDDLKVARDDNLEVKVGGLAVEFGVKLFLGGY